jgi:hypothetical protein
MAKYFKLIEISQQYLREPSIFWKQSKSSFKTILSSQHIVKPSGVVDLLFFTIWIKFNDLDNNVFQFFSKDFLIIFCFVWGIESFPDLHEVVREPGIFVIAADQLWAAIVDGARQGVRVEVVE